MSTYAWSITENYIDAKEKLVSGPSDASPELLEKLKKEGETFKMYDDDGTHYYTGKIIGDYDGFEPLDDYGEPNAGCTEIKYKNPTTNQWETL